MIGPVICSTCKHFREDDKINKCAAFPDGGIPWSVVVGENDHSQPLEGQQNDIIYEKRRTYA